MKQRLKNLAAQIAARSTRERVLLLLASVMLIALPFTLLVWQPMAQKRLRLERELVAQDEQIRTLARDADSRVLANQADPDAAVRARLAELQRQDGQLRASLLARQKELVAPEAVVPLLQHLLRGNSKLQLLSLRTLPVAGLSADAALNLAAPAPAAVPATGAAAAAAGPAAPPAAGSGMANVATALGNAGFVNAAGIATATNAVNGANAAAAANAATVASYASAAGLGSARPASAAGSASSASTAEPRYLLYRHGVEIVVQGAYLDMLAYLDALEAAPGQLFWSKAELDAAQSPNARLTLTLYTISLDKNWIAL